MASSTRNLRGVFISREEVENPKGTRKHPKNRHFQIDDEEEADKGEYKFGAIRNGMQGTLIPLTGDRGGPEGEQSVYGRIVIGKVYSGEDWDVVEDLLPDCLLEDADIELSEEGTATLIDSLEDAKAVQDREVQEKALEQQLQALEEQKKKEDCSKKIKITTKYGTYKGKCVDIVRDGEYVILVYSEDAAIFTPPVSDEKISLCCEGHTCEVYYKGVEVSLSSFNICLQIMELVKDK